MFFIIALRNKFNILLGILYIHFGNKLIYVFMVMVKAAIILSKL